MMRHIINFLVFSNIYVAFPVMCLTWATFLLAKTQVSPSLLVFVYSSTLFLYCFHRVYKLENKELPFYSARHIWAVRNRNTLLFLIGVGGLGSLYSLWFLPNHLLPWLAVPAIFGTCYSVPLFPFKQGFVRLRDVPFIKVFLIAFSVAWVTVFLPLAYYNTSINWWLFLERFFFVLAITIPFDIRDTQFDNTAGLKTLPVILGEKKAKGVSLISLVFFCWLTIVNHPFTFFPLAFTVSLFTGIVVWLSTERKTEHYYSLLLEGTMLILFLAVVVHNNYFG